MNDVDVDVDVDAVARKLVATRDLPAADGSRFFGAGDRARKLEQLRRPADWDRRLVIVTGERGSGKTHLLRATACRLDARVKVARIDAAAAKDPHALLRSVAQGYGLVAPRDAAADLVLTTIADHVRVQAELDRVSLIMVDDAHALESRAAEALLDLVERCGDQGQKLALFAEPAFVQVLERIYRKRGQTHDWHEVKLTPLAASEVPAYLRFRLAATGWERPLPFSARQIRDMARAARGLPGEINQLARTRLSKARRFRSLGDFPPLHRATAAAIVVLVLGAWLLWPASDQVARETLAIDLPSAPGQAPETGTAQALAAVPVATAAGEEVGPITLNTAGAAGGMGEPAGPAVAVATPAAVTPAASPEPPPAAAVSSPPAMRSPAQSQPAQPQSAPATATQPARAAQTPRGTSWVMAQPGHRYTLQLLGAANRDGVDAFLRRQPNPQSFAVIELSRNGTPWYVVIYGDYGNRAAAESASRSLPSSIGRVDPWIRSFGALQQEIRR
jgi:DamX protein